MDLNSILRDAWRITWQHRILWLLSLLMFLAMTPAGLLAGAFGGIAGVMAASGRTAAGADLFGLNFLYQLPVWNWVAIAVGMWAALVITTTLTWILQVATVRGAALAADQGVLTLRTSLAIGRQRLWSLIKLSLTFGVLMMALAVAPPLGSILFSVTSGGQAGAPGLLPIAQTGLAPLNSALGLALFLLMMAIAVEDLTPLKALRRTWGVLRHGWGQFLLVFGLSSLPSLAVIGLLLPLAVTIPFAFFITNGWIIPLLCGMVVVPLLLFILLFTAVFTTTMYTLVYRAAARLTQPGPAAAPSTV
jgi:hypothetical protein